MKNNINIFTNLYKEISEKVKNIESIYQDIYNINGNFDSFEIDYIKMSIILKYLQYDGGSHIPEYGDFPLELLNFPINDIKIKLRELNIQEKLDIEAHLQTEIAKTKLKKQEKEAKKIIDDLNEITDFIKSCRKETPQLKYKWDFEKANGNEYWVFDENNYSICEVSSETDLRKNINNIDDVIFNAKLISTAPILLETLEVIYKKHIKDDILTNTYAEYIQNIINTLK